MLRGLLVLLLLANGVFFAWTQGWLAPLLPPRADPREPERLAAQLRPELITVLSAKAASAAVPAVPRTNCRLSIAAPPSRFCGGRARPTMASPRARRPAWAES